MSHMHELGTLEASEQLIKDLYIDLRRKVNLWSLITHQTPQARMGYIGQHLVSVVTGFPGGKSGARGHDLVLPDKKYAEIKTCYRVDQLGKCCDCNTVVSSLESLCSGCQSDKLLRNDDSKWLISIRSPSEFEAILSPEYYFFVLFEYNDMASGTDNDVIASIWQVCPTSVGFAYCLIDYYLNIRSKSASKAPFNMWPHSLKFFLTNPKLIYRSTIKSTDEIVTTVHPALKNTYIDTLPNLNEFTRTRTLTADALRECLYSLYGINTKSTQDKQKLVSSLEDARATHDTENHVLCESLAQAVYLPLIKKRKNKLPESLRRQLEL
jgi:hypothetical protein